MKAVGLFLQQEAMNQGNFQARDFFGRSSFNRYYYALFLEVRETLERVDNSWSHLPHKSYPELLKGKFLKKINSASKQARKLGDEEKIFLCDKLKALTVELANTMEKANSIRVTADYYPHIPVQWLGQSRFSLNEVNVTQAHEWFEKASKWSRAVRLVVGRVRV